METLYQTLQDFFRAVGLPLQQDMEITVHPLEGLHGTQPLRSPLFRTNYYTFLLIEKGKGQYTIDNQSFELGPHSFYFTNPGHLKSFQIEVLLEGFMLTFSEKFVKQHFSGDFFTLFPFLVRESTPVMQLNAVISGELALLFEQMLREYKGHSIYKTAILTKHLAILLYKTKELLQSHQATVKAPNRPAEIANTFKKLLHENFRALAGGVVDKPFSVREFAEHLHLHPNYLTNVVKAETGKPASEWIQDRTIAEAQSMLNNTTLSVSEITFRLGFNDSTHFAKFFKKRTGMTPSAFRQSASR